MLGAVGFAALAVLGGVLVLRGRRVASYSGDFVRHEDGSRGRSDEGDAVSVAPPSYAEKEGDVEAEGEWEERRGGAV